MKQRVWVKGASNRKEMYKLKEAVNSDLKGVGEAHTHKTTLRVPHQAPGPRSCLELVDSEAPAH